MNFDCEIKERKLKSDSESIRKYIETQKDGDYILEIRRKRNKPNQTMRYLYKIYSILAKGMNDSEIYPETIKEMVKTKLLHYTTLKNPEGGNHIRFWSTADYTPEMYNDAIALVMHWGAINDIYIMSSEEYKLQFES